ncbi:MAG TPA: hypothetical protein VKB89_15210 [Xanthobacteraceae bacterium]|nr:hypothetical protein [Xanthobacteraceae bacterium]
MSVSRLAGGFVAFAIGAAVVTALAANPDERPPPMSPVTGRPEANAATGTNPATGAKSDRLAIPTVKSRPLSWACPQEPWPYGCQWRDKPTRKVVRPSRPS